MSHSTDEQTVERRSPGEGEGSHLEVLVIWLALMLFLGATIAFHFLTHGTLALLAAFGIAFAKMLLVMRYYMHLKYRPHLVWLFSGAAFLWLIILFSISLSDYFTRHWIVLIP